MVEKKLRKVEQWQDTIARLYPEYISQDNKERVLSRTVTFQVCDSCNLACKYCVDGDTLIRMADNSLKPIKNIEIGDEILAFDEYAEKQTHTKVLAIVEQKFVHMDKLIEVEFETGEKIRITKNHRVLVQRNSYNNNQSGFVPIGDLKVGESVYRFSILDSLFNYNPFKKTKIKSIKELNEETLVYNIGTSSHTYIANDIAVHNCYQINKGKRSMSFDTAKKFIDLLLSGEKGFSDYVNPEISPSIILEFIGGEPFLEIELIDKVVDYFRERTIELMHPWATNYCISICSNGVLYFDERVQKFLSKNKDHISFSITIDGNKELHDSCRVFYDGTGSYDIAVSGANDWMAKGNYMGSKITIAPGNLNYLYDAIIHMVNLGYLDINANCVYEKGWEQNHAIEFYKQLKNIADYFLDNDLVGEVYCSLFEENFFTPKDEDDLQTWCGGNAMMLACDPDGYLYPCIRYMESSLGDSRQPIRIGSVYEGIGQSKCHMDCINCLKKVDRRTQNTDECFYCPIANGCSDCLANDYQESGDLNKRSTNICEMHKARSLANVYLWNKYYQKNDVNKKFKMYCPKEWALNIISEDEYNMLLKLSE